MKSFLIEIGSEEIPARFISVGLAALRQDITGLLKSQNLSFGNITESATPRRLCLFIEDIEEKQEDRTIETFGPPIKAAYDSSGAPTKAATGFARSLNIEVTDLKVKTTERGDYVYAIVESKGRLTSDILQESLPGLIASLKLPKTMRWG
ncbi:glycine--tRNA ligase subunit beta, partial [bacterium]|nr:glycine--tRNA ligase subunit beta [bacterium]